MRCSTLQFTVPFTGLAALVFRTATPLQSRCDFPAEQARIVQLLVERVDVSLDGADIRLRTEGLTNLVADLRTVRPERRAA